MVLNWAIGNSCDVSEEEVFGSISVFCPKNSPNTLEGRAVSTEALLNSAMGK